MQLYQLFLPGSGERAGATQVSWSALCGVYEAYEEVCAVCVLEGFIIITRGTSIEEIGSVLLGIGV